MKTIRFDHAWYSKAESWFCEHSNILEQSWRGLDFVEFKAALYPLLPTFLTFRDGIKDLSIDEDRIFASFDQKFRYEVKRGARECITAQFSDESNNLRIAVVFPAYINFCRRKKIDAIRMDVLDRYSGAGALLISVARWHGLPVQYHLYFCGDRYACLLASFPSSDESIKDKKLFGWANRLLHWEDIRHLKARKLEIYVLGGLGNPVTSRNAQIVKFKMEMNPEIRTFFYGIIPLTWKAKIYYNIKQEARLSFGQERLVEPQRQRLHHRTPA